MVHFLTLVGANLDKIGLATLLGVWLFAATKGGGGERLGASLVAVDWIGTTALVGMTPVEAHEMLRLASDIFAAVGLLAIAIAYSSRWLGVAMFLQAIALALHANTMMGSEPPPLWHLLALAILAFGMLWVIAISTAATWWSRSRRAKAKTAAALPPGAEPSPA
jgi:hypothetical protein